MYKVLTAILLSQVMMVGYILFLDYHNHTQHVNRVSEAHRISEERNHQSMLQICKTYREWQRLPDLTDNITAMDPLCEQHEKMIH